MGMDGLFGATINSVEKDDVPKDAIKVSLDDFPEINAMVGNVFKEIKDANKFEGMVKMTYDKGLGELQRAVNGGYTGNIINDKGKITGHVVLENASSATAVAGSVMSVMSIVTSQYYLHEINKSLDYIQVKLENIGRFLEIDKRSHIVSREHYINGVQKNIIDIQNNSIESHAVISEMQQLEIESYSDYLAFTDMITGLIESLDQAKKQEDILEIIKKVNEYLPQLWSALYLYACSKYLSMILSGTVDEKRINNLYNEISEMINDYDTKIQEYYIESHDMVRDHKMYKTNDALFWGAMLFPGAVSIPGMIAHTFAVDEIKNMVHDKKDKDKQDATVDLFNVFYYTCQDTEPIKKICDDIKLYNAIYNDKVEYIFDEEELYIVHNSQ